MSMHTFLRLLNKRRTPECNVRMPLVPPGPSLIQQLLDDFLFRASRIIINSSNPTPSPAPSHDFHPKYDWFFLSRCFV